MDIQIKLNNSDIIKPKYHTDMSASIDLYAVLPKQLVCVPESRHLVKTGLSINMNNSDMCAIILPVNGLNGIILSNSVGLIDSNYNGEIILHVWNSSNYSYIIQPNEKIAQIVFMPILKPSIKIVDEFTYNNKRTKAKDI